MRPVGAIDFYRGRWRVRLRADAHRRTIGSYDTCAEAEGVLAESVACLVGTTNDPTARRDTLGTWAARWLNEREKTHRDADGDRKRWNAHLAGTPLAAKPLAAISSAELRRFLRERLEAPLPNGERRARQTIANVWTTLRACLRGAVEAELLEVSPADGVQLSKGAIAQDVEDHEKWTFLSLDEIYRVLALELREDQRAAFTLGLFTGLRAGELLGLRWCDVELEGNRPEVVVRRSFLGATKRGKVARVPLLPSALRALGRWRAAAPPLADKPEALVFPSDGGGPHASGYDWQWAHSTDRRVTWLGLRHRAGIRRPAGIRITWHSATRHSCASHLLLGSWAPAELPRALRIEEVSRWLRHASIGVTQRYAHLTSDALHAVARPAQISGPGSGPSGPEARAAAAELRVIMALPARIERAANGLGNRCSIP